MFERDGRSMPSLLCGPCRLPRRTIPLPRFGVAQLRASGNSNCCCCCWSVTKCTQATDMMEITHGVPRHFSIKHIPPAYTLHTQNDQRSRLWSLPVKRYSTYWGKFYEICCKERNLCLASRGGSFSQKIKSANPEQLS